ncbi:hypothetical protein JOC77_000527 [Peribacillus deserti]|uniref:DUF3918 domain-containing protein n=1 Tax=Peribacillus deserti TaxID=673318 RepID=A0ABS2QDF1_9BACI|nr:hypothetical protein [Peribacillus deserti]MBM7691122.1 hypothetical protein [Peribacillus deserti]
MDRKKMMMSSLALGAAYLLRNKNSRQQVMTQLQSMGLPKKK